MQTRFQTYLLCSKEPLSNECQIYASPCLSSSSWMTRESKAYSRHKYYSIHHSHHQPPFKQNSNLKFHLQTNFFFIKDLYLPDQNRLRPRHTFSGLTCLFVNVESKIKHQFITIFIMSINLNRWFTWLVDRRHGSLRTSFRNGMSISKYLDTTYKQNMCRSTPLPVMALRYWCTWYSQAFLNMPTRSLFFEIIFDKVFKS